MRKLFFTSILFCCVVFNVFAQIKPTIAILPFTGGSMDDGETIAELFSFDQTLNSVFAPVPRTSINSAIRMERSFQMSSGMTDPETISRIGLKLGARYIVAGTITNLGSQRLLVISIMRIDNLQQIAGDWRSYTDIGEIQDKLPEMARDIISSSRKDTSRLPRLAVLPFQTPRGDREADALSQILAVEIVRSGSYAVYPRTKTLEQITTEYRNQYNSDTAADQAIVIGRGDNPLLALSGAVRSLGSNRRMFNAAIINVESGVQTKGDYVNFDAIEEGIISMRLLGGKLTGVDLTVYEYTAATAEQFRETIKLINLQGEGDYTITIGGDFTVNYEIIFNTNARKTIVITGDNRERTIRNGRSSVLFNVPKGITLVLRNNLRLDGNGMAGRVLSIGEQGTLRLEAGAVITGSAGGGVIINNKANFLMLGGIIGNNSGGSHRARDNRFTLGGSGVFVNSNGVFSMSGGVIISNTSSGMGGGVAIESGGQFTMNGGIIQKNISVGLAGGGHGGGVAVYSEGIFRMTGGNITDNTCTDSISSTFGGGVSFENDSTFIKSGGTIANNTAKYGSQVYGSYSKTRNSTTGTSVNLDSRLDGRSGGWERSN